MSAVLLIDDAWVEDSWVRFTPEAKGVCVMVRGPFVLVAETDVCFIIYSLSGFEREPEWPSMLLVRSAINSDGMLPV